MKPISFAAWLWTDDLPQRRVKTKPGDGRTAAVLANGGRIGVVRNSDEMLGLLDAWGTSRCRSFLRIFDALQRHCLGELPFAPARHGAGFVVHANVRQPVDATGYVTRLGRRHPRHRRQWTGWKVGGGWWKRLPRLLDPDQRQITQKVKSWSGVSFKEEIMQRVRKFAVAVAALAVAGIAGSADAQSPGTQGQPGGPGYGPSGMMAAHMGSAMMGWNGQGSPMCTMMTGHIEGRLAYARAELKITPAQEPLWTTYANAVRDNAQTMASRCAPMMAQGTAALSLPDRLDLHEQLMAARLDALRTINKTLKPLYASFDDAQKQTANQLFWGPMGMMGMSMM
jgi:hypothetical protein